MSDETEDSKADADDAILDEACDRYEQITSDDKDNRANYKADLNFVYSPGSQWPDDVRETRNGWKELCLEFNQLKQFVAQVVNDQLQNRPGIRVHPAGGDASEEVAEIEQGMIRAIEYDSNADDVYKNAFKLAVAGGRGWWRVCSEYETDDGFNQRLVIKPIQDSNTVKASLDYEQPDGSDRSFVFVECPYTRTEFENKWPDAKPISWEQTDTYWNSGKETIIVADYYRRTCTKRTMVLMSDGAKGWKDEMPAPPPGVTIKQERDVEQYKVEWFTLAGGNQVLERYDWPGTIIPVICVAGEDMILDGKRVYQGLTRHARDAQSMLNFGMTQQATQLALSPRAPWVMAEGQDEGYQQMWRDANNKNWSALIYKPTTIDGVLVPPPQRTQPAMVSEGWDRWCQMMIGMIKSTIGMYEQSLGQKGNEVSGRAITAREKQGDTATFNYVNNWHMGIALTGRILVEVLPKFYDTQRIVATVGLDDTKKLVTINQAAPDPDDPLKAIQLNDVTKGKYAVVVEAGPSFATKREESREALTDFVQAFPAAAAVAGDLIVKSLDIADADVLAERMKLTLPPQIQQAEAARAEGKTPPDPQVMAQLQEKDAQLQQAAQTMEAMHQEIQKLESGQQAKLAAVQSDAQVKTQVAEMDAQQRAQDAQRESQAAIEKARTDAALALQTAQIEQQTALRRAQMEQETAIKKAVIERMTKLQIAEMQDETTRDTAAAQIETQARTSDADRESQAEQADKAAKASQDK
jgi:hypothetical protein